MKPYLLEQPYKVLYSREILKMSFYWMLLLYHQVLKHSEVYSTKLLKETQLSQSEKNKPILLLKMDKPKLVLEFSREKEKWLLTISFQVNLNLLVFHQLQEEFLKFKLVLILMPMVLLEFLLKMLLQEKIKVWLFKLQED